MSATGALGAIAVKYNLQPRPVNPEIVQRTLLDFNVGAHQQLISSEKMTKAPGVLKELESKGTQTDAPLRRIDAAEILYRALTPAAQITQPSTAEAR